MEFEQSDRKKIHRINANRVSLEVNDGILALKLFESMKRIRGNIPKTCLIEVEFWDEACHVENHSVLGNSCESCHGYGL